MHIIYFIHVFVSRKIILDSILSIIQLIIYILKVVNANIAGLSIWHYQLVQSRKESFVPSKLDRKKLTFFFDAVLYCFTDRKASFPTYFKSVNFIF